MLTCYFLYVAYFDDVDDTWWPPGAAGLQLFPFATQNQKTEKLFKDNSSFCFDNLQHYSNYLAWISAIQHHLPPSRLPLHGIILDNLVIRGCMHNTFITTTSILKPSHDNVCMHNDVLILVIGLLPNYHYLLLRPVIDT